MVAVVHDLPCRMDGGSCSHHTTWRRDRGTPVGRRRLCPSTPADGPLPLGQEALVLWDFRARAGLVGRPTGQRSWTPFSLPLKRFLRRRAFQFSRWTRWSPPRGGIRAASRWRSRRRRGRGGHSAPSGVRRRRGRRAIRSAPRGRVRGGQALGEGG